MNILRIILTAIVALCASHIPLQSQSIYKYEQRDSCGNKGVTLTFFSNTLSQYIPHIVRQYENAKALHGQIWSAGQGVDCNSLIKPPFMMLTDWDDDGNGGAAPLPHNFISIGMAPLNASYYVSPATERYTHLFKHEYTHTLMTDLPAPRDRNWRRLLFNSKVDANSKYPISSVWSWLTVPRWYAPRWYHEGIACFMETWLSGGVGRAMGGYDEMYFRSLVADDVRLSTVVGLESEGSTKDFQLGTTAYLYGMRFVNYLVLKYGFDKLVAFYNRTPDSKAFFASQFKKVYGRHLRDVWNEWQAYERQHQRRNLDEIAKYPLTELTALGKSLGSASPLVVDDSLMVGYAAVNYRGDFAHVERIDLRTGERRKLAKIDGAMLYQTAYLTLDRNNQRLFWTDRNGGIRGIRWISLKDKDNSTAKASGSARQPVSKRGHLGYQRVSNIVYDNANDRLYGLQSHEGVTSIVRYDANMEDAEVLYRFRFGVSVADLDVSHDGEMLAMTVIGTRGDNSLILFRVKDMEDADLHYTTLKQLDDTNLTQFRFSHDDTHLVGMSYYTGAGNIWEINTDGTGDLRLLSNVATGLFAPYHAANDSLYAYQFTHEGMTPVRLSHRELHDCNAIELLGHKAYEANPSLLDMQKLKTPLPKIDFGEVYDSIKVYRPLREMEFMGSYPIISGFTDRKSWNEVTPVVGYHVSFSDPVGLSSLNLEVAASPWSHHRVENQWHATAEWDYWDWNVTASWNPTSFYDLFGPSRSSRKGYNFGVSYGRKFTLQTPFSWDWNVSVNTYGRMDALPLFQNVAVDDGIHSFQTFSAHIGARKTRTSLGGIQAEQGYVCGLDLYSYLAGGRLFPSVTATLDKGVLLPVLRNTSGWLRMAVGQNFGNEESALGNQYFGAFGNNYVDHGATYRYRAVSAMPGHEIDAIEAHSFAKATAELNLQPVTFRNLGMLCLYPTQAWMSLFATDLAANPWGRQQFNNYVSVGAQLNFQIVLFNYMNTTWSFGFARSFNQRSSGLDRCGNEFMVSLKLL